MQHIALGFEVPGKDLRGLVMIAFNDVSIGQDYQGTAVLFSNGFDPLPELDPALPEPPLGGRGFIVSSVIQPDSGRTDREH